MKLEFTSKIDFPEMERKVLNYWEEEKIFYELREKNKKGNKFTFLEGPPTANGLPHLGHALTRAIKDVVLRYHAMKGENVFPWIGGWDCHGLPVELEVEKTLKINSKKEIEKFGIKEFNLKCKENVFKYKKEWELMTKRIGFWIDLENAYSTMENKYIESVWWALKRMWDLGLLEKSYKIVPYCPRCGTPLSSHEVSQGYKETEDPSIYVKFKVDGEDAYFLVWTTTPWTLPSNMFLAVGEDIDYVLLDSGEKYYIAEAIANKLFQNPKILKRIKGKELIGKKYIRPIDEIIYEGKGFFVVGGDFVSTEEGTGIVHIAPAFGADDFEIGKRENVSIINPVDREGKFIEGPWKGKFVKEADREIITYLKKKGLLFKSEKIKHTYPFCWRCNTPLLYYPLDTWYIKVSTMRDKLIDYNMKINWMPNHLKEGRFGNFLTEAKDWALSRDRYWGTPLPIWKCDEGHYFVPSSFDDLLNHCDSKPEYFEPHRPWVDDLKVKCPVCGKDMKREPYVIDVWFDSGSSTFAQFHYPYENRDNFDEFFPVDFITEGIDQTRGWFYTLHVVNGILFNSNAYKNVLTLGLVLNEKGEKMSKSKGDVVDPLPWMDSLGADAIRLYMYSIPPWRDRRVSEHLIKEYRSKTIETLWNSYIFYRNNSYLDNFKFDGGEIINTLDLWIISRLNSTIKCIRKNMDSYEISKATECIESFIKDLSNWYIRRSRRRFWEEKITPEKLSGYRALYTVFKEFTKAIAPFTPFIADYIYQDLTGNRSVHLEKYPEYDEGLINPDLEKEMELLIKIVEMGRRARQIANIKVRQPLNLMVISTEDQKTLQILGENSEIIKEELNVKRLDLTSELRYLKFKVKLNPSLAGPILKDKFTEVSKIITSMDPKEFVNNSIKIMNFEIPKEAIIIEEESDPLFVHVSEGNIHIFLSKEIDKDLYFEGLAREIVRRIQIMRKEMDLEYNDRIEVFIHGDEEIEETIKKFKDYIQNETLSIIKENIENPYLKEWEIEDKKVSIGIKVINK
ncbi:MAG: isoleucine--tRNA ligase [Thermoplasmata archaeon]|nr:isoleucine--tRNA ligase [Euryarchaeota archaeon]MVT35976.1 isoleucine--tRNA ligase [Euryarchaeota archaeon]